MEATATRKNNEGVAKFLQKDFKKAEEHYKKAINEDGLNSTALNNLGLLYHNDGKYEKAVKHFEKAIAINEKDTYYLNLANTLVFQKAYEKAEKMYLRSLEINPQNGNTLLSLARFYSFTGRPQKATPILKKLAVKTAVPGIILELAKNYIALKQFEDALKLVLPLEPMEKEGHISYLIGVCEFYLKNYSLAEKAFKKSLSMTPNERSPRHYLALTYLSLGNPKKALDHLEFLLKLFPEHIKYRLDRVAVLLHESLIDEALKDIEKVLNKDPKNTKALRYQKILRKKL